MAMFVRLTIVIFVLTLMLVFYTQEKNWRAENASPQSSESETAALPADEQEAPPASQEPKKKSSGGAIDFDSLPVSD